MPIYSVAPAAEAGEGRQHLVPVPLADLMTAPTPAPPFVIRDLIPRREVTLLGGHGGAGKSILGLTLCAYVAGGAHTWAGFAVADGHALFVSLEDPGAVVRFRLRRILEACTLDPEKIGRRLHVLDGTGGDAALASELNDAGVRRLGFTAAMGEVAAAATGKTLIVIDGASDAFDGDENSRRQVRAFLRELARIAREADAGLILLAHIDKAAARFGANGNSYSGSSQWHNSVRARLALVANDGTVELVPEKLQHAKMAEPVPLIWTDSGVLIPTDRRAAQAEAEARDATLAAEDAEHVLDAIRRAHLAGVSVSVARTGNYSAKHCLATFDIPRELSAGKADRFWRALDLLLAERRIVVEDYITDWRKTRQRFAPAAPVSCAAPVPPYPPVPAQAQGAPLRQSDSSLNWRGTGALAQDGRCPRCAGEGCAHCGTAGRASA